MKLIFFHCYNKLMCITSVYYNDSLKLEFPNIINDEG